MVNHLIWIWHELNNYAHNLAATSEFAINCTCAAMSVQNKIVLNYLIGGATNNLNK